MLITMKKEDIGHLAHLARIRVSDEEVAALVGEFDEILGYVAQINTAVDMLDTTPYVPPHANVFRPDEVVNASGVYTEALLNAAPKRYKNYVEVKKILGSTDE